MRILITIVATVIQASGAVHVKVIWEDVVWLHVDYEPHLLDFYRRCGFRHTEAGLMHLP